MYRFYRATASLTCIAAIIPTVVLAEPVENNPDGYMVTAGAGVIVTPDFEGAKDYSISAAPVIGVENLYGFNLSIMDGLSYNLYSYENEETGLFFAFRPSINLAASRDKNGGNIFSSEENKHLKGLGEVDSGIDVGGVIEVGYGPLMSSLAVNQEVAGGHSGLTATWEVGAMMPVSQDAMISLNISTTWADEDYMQSFFGITQRQATRSVYNQFDAEAGFKDVSVGLMGEYRLTKNVTMLGTVGYTRLLGTAADSPIVRGDGGSEDQFFSMIGLTYSWGPGNNY